MRSFYLGLLLITNLNLQGQKTDFDWLLGFSLLNNPLDSTFGISHIDFNQEPPSIYYEYITMDFQECNVSVCDFKGDLLFYSNCVDIFNKENEAVENSIDFNEYPPHYILNGGMGLSLEQGILAFVLENGDNEYVLLHEKYDYESVFNDVLVYGVGLYFTTIDMDENSGLGKVIQKDIVIIEDTLSKGKLTATRHANGRDWWIIASEYNTNRYYRIFLSPNGPQLLESQAIGEPTINGLGQAVFSPDGSWYVRNNMIGGPAGDDYLDIYRFDRCTGLLSDHIRFPYGNGVNAGGGVAISPNNRFLYVSHRDHIYQYDLQAADIEGSKDTVAIFDGFSDPFPAAFFLAQLAPDGKIYLNCTNGIRYLHRIEFPNKKGIECEVNQHIIHLPTVNAFSLPNFPNYRLGPLDGSSCDTLGIDNMPLAGFRYDVDTTNLLKVEFTDNSWYEPETWHWDFDDGTNSGEVDPEHIFPEEGVYEVCLTVSNPYGSDTICRLVNLGLNSTSAAPQGPVDALVYPNPASDKITLKLPAPLAKRGEFRLFNTMGQLMKAYPVPEGYEEYRFPVHSLPAAMYLYTLSTEGDILVSGKFIKGG